MPAPSRTAAEALRPLVENEAVAQLARFVVAGAGVTLLATAVYLVAAGACGVPPFFANVLNHATGVTAGFMIHGRWSFRAAGDRRAMLGRFLVASTIAFGLNSLWVWIGTVLLHGPAWSAVPGMVFVTPLASFAINRWWVFAADDD